MGINRGVSLRLDMTRYNYLNRCYKTSSLHTICINGGWRSVYCSLPVFELPVQYEPEWEDGDDD